MTDAQFTEQVRAMTGLLPHMVDYFVRVSASLQDAERDEVISRLKPLNEELLHNRKVAEQIADEAVAQAEELRSGELQDLLTLAEKTDDAGPADDILSK